MFIEGMKSGQENSWMNNLSEENMKLVAQLTFDSIGSDPRYNVFSPDAPGFEPSQTQIESLIESYLNENDEIATALIGSCLLYTSPSPRDLSTSRMPSSA